MKRMFAIPLAIVAAGCAAGGAVATGQSAPTGQSAMSAEGSRSAAEALAGKVAGEPVRCVRSSELRGNETLDDGRILFRSRGNLDYVNTPPAACPEINQFRAIKTRGSLGTNLCAGELLTVFDTQSGIEHGTCALGEFTPYRRAR